MGKPSGAARLEITAQINQETATMSHRANLAIVGAGIGGLALAAFLSGRAST